MRTFKILLTSTVILTALTATAFAATAKPQPTTATAHAVATAKAPAKPTAAAKPTTTDRDRPVIVEETVVVTDATPAAQRDAAALARTERKVIQDDQALAATAARERRDERQLARDRAKVAATRVTWDRDVAKGHADAAGHDAIRHQQALAGRDWAAHDLRVARQREEQLERARTTNLVRADKQALRGERQLDHDLKTM